MESGKSSESHSFGSGSLDLLGWTECVGRAIAAQRIREDVLRPALLRGQSVVEQTVDLFSDALIAQTRRHLAASIAVTDRGESLHVRVMVGPPEFYDGDWDVEPAAELVQVVVTVVDGEPWFNVTGSHVGPREGPTFPESAILDRLPGLLSELAELLPR